MTENKPARRSTRLSNWMIGVGLALVAAMAYAVIAVHVRQHGIN